MKVAILSPVWFPVPPTGYGGIEWVVALLADGLVDAGHDVTLFASGDSRTKAKLEAVFEEAPSSQIGLSPVELRHTLLCYTHSDEFDVVNEHSGQAAAAMGGLLDTPVVHTVHGPLEEMPLANYRGIAALSPDVGLVSISMNQRKPAPISPGSATCRTRST